MGNLSDLISPISWTLKERTFVWGQRTYLMGVLNVTPDSFSDGGDFYTPSVALAQAHRLVKAGADVIDVGGESTKPGAIEVSLTEELERVLPIVQALHKEVPVPISVDTTKAEVARQAIACGADMINDISGATFDPEMLPTVAALHVPIVLMHTRGTPQTMQQLTNYKDLIREIHEFLETRISAAISAGIDRSRIIIDPGLGFAKNYHQNLEILRHLQDLRSLNCPILVGPSRKAFIGKILDQPDPKERMWGTAAACCAAIASRADLVRVHDVEAMRDVCRVADAIWRI
jgi:dihydropteroate synthase